MLSNSGHHLRDNIHYDDRYQAIVLPKDSIANVTSITDVELFSDPIIFTGLLFTPPLISKGIGLNLRPPSTGRHLAVLRGLDTTYSFREKAHFGNDVAIIVAYQSDEGSRLALSGSIDLFSNQHVRRSESNLLLIESLFDWVSKRQGIVKLLDMTDKKRGGVEQSFYTVKDSLVGDLFTSLILSGLLCCASKETRQ